MNFELTEEQKQLKALVRQFCEREVDLKLMAELDEKTIKAKTVAELKAAFPYELCEKLHKVGLRQLGIPQKYGGTAPAKGVNVTMAVIVDEAGYAGGGPVDGILGVLWFVCRTIATNRYVTEEQRKWFFSQIMNNPRLQQSGNASEPSGATDIFMPYDEGGKNVLQVNAHKEGKEWVINGDKMFSSGRGVADIAMVLARTKKEGPISQSATWFWVPMDAPGVTLTHHMMLAQEPGGNCQTHFDNVRVPESALLGEVDKGYSITESFFTHKWLPMSGVGSMQLIYEHMRDFAKQRTLGGKPLIKHSSIAVKLGDLAMNLEACRALLYKVAWETDKIEEAGCPPVGQANWYWMTIYYAFVKQVAWRFCELSHDIYGGIAGSVDMPTVPFLRNTYYFRPAGLTPDGDLMRASKDYDIRYSHVK